MEVRVEIRVEIRLEGDELRGFWKGEACFVDERVCS